MAKNIRMSGSQRKSVIIEAVLEHADIDGPERLSTEKIAKLSGLTHAGIFRHFPTKQDIWIAVAKEISLRAKDHWDIAIKSDLLPRQKIEKLVAAHLSFLVNTPAILTILFSYELQRANAELRAYFTAMMLQMRDYLVAEFVNAGHEHESASDLAFLIISLIQGLAIRWSISQRGFDLEKEGRKLLCVQLDMMKFKK